ncbi:hypothetical protein [Nocardia sp. NBC_00403]|uniref:hypothetical protein n=1 Tax=Nocardia sp. NBC_00403 TaxID=2975990 RepID=UPI002E228377
MSLDSADMRACRYTVAEAIRYRRRIGAPIPQWLRRLHERLDAELLQAASENGPSNGTSVPDSEVIGAAESARILGCSTRHVRRLAADLDGQRVGRAWVFDRAVVTTYTQARKE